MKKHPWFCPNPASGKEMSGYETHLFWSVFLIVTGFFLSGCGAAESGLSEESTDVEVAGPPPISLAIDIPGVVGEYEPFLLTVRALTETGATAITYEGEVEVTASQGLMSPQVITLADGKGGAELVLHRAGNVLLFTEGGGLEGTAPIHVTAPNWERSQSDAVLKGNTVDDGHWSYGGIGSPSVISAEGEDLWMYFSTTDATTPDVDALNYSLGRARSSDGGMTWSFEPDSPLWTAEAAEVAGIGPGTVAHDAQGGMHLWFTHLAENGRTAIAYATSSDGINWSRLDCLELTVADMSYWSKGGVSEPVAVILEDGGIRLWFTASAETANTPTVIGMAEGSCESGWSSISIALSSAGAGSWDMGGLGTPHVWREGSLWKMLYSGLASATAKPALGYPHSDDGLTWSTVEENPVFMKSGMWEVHGLEHPYVHLRELESPILFYNGLPSDKRPRVGHAVPKG